MEEIRTENVAAESVVTEETPEKNWKNWLGTEAATRWVYLIFGLCAIVLLMIVSQFSTDAICCGDWDGYYHIRWSSLLWENFSHGKWLPEFKWLPLTVLGPEVYADHHFLFHLLQIPFLWFFEPVMAAKIATVFYASLAIFSVYWLLFYYKVDNLLIWFGALVTCANPFFYRMNMGKAPPLTIIISIIGIYLLFERKYVWLAPLMFLFVWTYSLFPLLFIAAFIWTLIIAWNERRFEWRPLAFTGGGMILGNIINPYFPQNFMLFYEHLATKLTAGNYDVPVGGEWYPYSSLDLLTHFPVALIAMLVGYVLFKPRNGKLPEKATFFLGFVSLLFFAQFVSKRYAEYFPPFSILFAAFSWQAFKVPSLLLPEDFKRDIQPYLDVEKGTEKEEYIRAFKQVAVWVLGIVFIVTAFLNFRGLNLTGWADTSLGKTPGFKTLFSINKSGLMGEIKNNEPNTKYQRSMQWFLDNVPEGERIYNCNWDDFPKMFFYDQKHNYVYGLDPNYLYTKNPDLYKRMQDINAGKVDDPAPEIRDDFGSKYIFSDAKENQDFIAKALNSGWTDKVYSDDEAIILKIRDVKGEAPSETDDAESQLTPEEKKRLDEEEKNANAANNQNSNVEEEEPER